MTDSIYCSKPSGHFMFAMKLCRQNRHCPYLNYLLYGKNDLFMYFSKYLVIVLYYYQINVGSLSTVSSYMKKSTTIKTSKHLQHFALNDNRFMIHHKECEYLRCNRW